MFKNFFIISIYNKGDRDDEKSDDNFMCFNDIINK